MNSIRGRLTRRLLVGQLILLGSLLAAMWTLVGGLLEEQFDEGLIAQVDVLATLLSQDGPEVELEFSDELMPQYVRPVNPDYFQIELLGVGILERSISLHRLGVTLEDVPVEDQRVWSAPLPDGRDGHWVRLQMPIHEYNEVDELGRRGDRGEVVILVGTGLAPLTNHLRQLLAGLSILAGIAVILSLTLARGAVRTGLESLGQLEDTLTHVASPTDTSLLDAFDPPRELAAVRKALLEMMERLNETFERERRLSSNIAHELRTPIAELLTASEVALQTPSSPEELEQAVAQAREIAREMDSVVHTLLRISREGFDEARRGDLEVEVDLVALASRQAQRVSTRAKERSMILCSVDTTSPQRVPVDPRHASLVLGILFENAIEHGSPGTRVTWSVTREDTTTIFELRNRQEGLAAGDGELVQEPFWSGAEARGASHHAGLGLSLARSVCDSRGFKLETVVEPGLFRARLHIAERRSQGQVSRP